MTGAERAWLPAVGLCSICTSAQSQPSARGSTFWRCLRAEEEPTYLRYPPLPVRGCPGFEALAGTSPPGRSDLGRAT